MLGFVVVWGLTVVVALDGEWERESGRDGRPEIVLVLWMASRLSLGDLLVHL